MALELDCFPDVEHAAPALAAAIADEMRHALSVSTGRALLLVSGGRSPLPFFASLSLQNLPWNRIDVSLVDERGVPFDHPDANAALVFNHLLRGPAQAARWLSLVAATPTSSESAEGAAEWDVVQHAACAANANPALATPAVIVLGLGVDGHTASLFVDAPQWPYACTTDERYVAIAPTHAPHARISLSLQALIKQGICYVWSSGDAKLAVIKRAQKLSGDVAAGRIAVSSLVNAGPLALLSAHPAVTLKVFHSEEE